MPQLKRGSTCYRASIVGRTIDIDEYVLRTIRSRNVGSRSFPFYITYEYWTLKLSGVTWGKRSTKRGDYGWLSNIPEEFRHKIRRGGGRPFSKTQRGALHSLATKIRKLIKDYGCDFDMDEEGVTLGEQLKLVVARKNRMNK